MKSAILGSNKNLETIHIKNHHTKIIFMFTLKKFCFVAILLFFTNTLLAQDADSDGVLDSEDVCPMVKGTKANRGCAAIDTKSISPNSKPDRKSVV